MTEEIHDMSRVDAFMASRRRAMFFHSVWKPMLAGAVGAAIMSAAVIGSVWVILPKISTRDVVVDHVVPHDVPFDNHTPQDKPFDNYVPHTKPFDPPVPAPKPLAAAPPEMGPQSPYAAKTPEENKFVDQPEYKTAKFHGRIVKSRDGHELSFEDGTNFWPRHWDEASGRVINDPDKVISSDQFIGDLGMCVPRKNEGTMNDCVAMHNGIETPIGGSRLIHSSEAEPRSPSSPTTAAANMVNVNVDVAGYPVTAMVDTGCSFPMAIPEALADALIQRDLAIKAGRTPSMLADGKVSEVGVVLIRSITVDGRTLDTVEASVSPGNSAPILLGLGALNRLGPYTITDGRLVFTGEQPA